MFLLLLVSLFFEKISIYSVVREFARNLVVRFSRWGVTLGCSLSFVLSHSQYHSIIRLMYLARFWY